MQVKIQQGYIALYSSWLIKYLGSKDAKGAAFFPFILFKSKEYEVPWIVNHEKIHFRQQIELLFVGLEILKLYEYIYFKFFLKKNKFERYLYSACEQEAYLNQNDPTYLKTRKPYAIVSYIRNKKEFTLDPNKLGELIFK